METDQEGFDMVISVNDNGERVIKTNKSGALYFLREEVKSKTTPNKPSTRSSRSRTSATVQEENQPDTTNTVVDAVDDAPSDTASLPPPPPPPPLPVLTASMSSRQTTRNRKKPLSNDRGDTYSITRDAYVPVPYHTDESSMRTPVGSPSKRAKPNAQTPMSLSDNISDEHIAELGKLIGVDDSENE